MTIADRLTAMLHRRHAVAGAGDATGGTITTTSAYHLPGVPQAEHQYGRWTNPGWSDLEAALGLLEQAEVIIFPSGMAAIAAVLLSQCKPGDHLLLASDGYYTTRLLAEQYLVRAGVRLTIVATRDLAKHDLGGTDLALIESPSNPQLDLVDLAVFSARAAAAGTRVIVDNTTMTMLGQQPLDLGAAATVASDTKALGGHGDVLFGHVATRDPALAEAVRTWRKLSGSIPGPFEAWMVARSLESFEVRLERMSGNALAVAEALDRHPALSVVYPGLPSHPDHALAARQMRSFGTLIGLTLASEQAADAFIAACPALSPQTSFGATHSSAERRARWGDAVAPGFVRLSIGCEPIEPLRTAILAAL